ncbi:unnamed protein product [Pedinophyceae sp. YPF-701]|nr:unnamed protein product [Pedinophyceae sp. YPF-701]
MRMFREAFHRALARIRESYSDEDFEKDFAWLEDTEDKMLVYGVLKQVLRAGEGNAQSEFEDVVAEYQLGQKLNNIDALCAENGLTQDGLPALATQVAQGPGPAASTLTARFRAQLRERDELRALADREEAEEREAERHLQRRRDAVLGMAARLGPVGDQLAAVHRASAAWVDRPPVE